MANDIVKVYYPDSGNNMQFVYAETRGNFYSFVENINSFVGRLDMVPQAFEEGSIGQQYRMYWIDEDNDKVLINSDYSLRIFLAKTNGVKKVYVEEKDNPPTPFQSQQPQQQSPTVTSAPQAESTSQKPVHGRVQCDNCDVQPIVGFRYKCAQCYDYDLCEKCEQKKAHPDHVMYRFPVPLPSHTELNRRFFKKMRHGCFGRPDAEAEGERPRKCGRRRHNGGHVAGGSGAAGAFSNFYTMMCDLAEGMDHDDIQTATTPSAPPQPEPEATKAQASNASSEAPRSEPRQETAGNNENEDEVPLLFPAIDPAYARAGVQALKGFSEIFGKLLDPLGIVVEVDVGLKNDKKNSSEPSDAKATTPEGEKPSTSTSGTENKQTTTEAQPQPTSSGTQTPIFIDLSGSPSASSVAPAEPEASETNQPSSADLNDGIRVFASNTSSQPSSQVQEQQPEQTKDMDIDLNPTDVSASAEQPSEANGASKKRGSTPIESSWTLIDKQFDELRLGQNEGENQQTSATATAAATSTSPPQSDVNYAQLSRDLLSHIQAEEWTKQPDSKPSMTTVHHPDRKINNAVIAMMAMGFSNEGGWLTNLLETVDGDIPKALELLHPSR